MTAPGSLGIPQAIEDSLRQLGVTESDLEERFIRARGPGGQHVNKTATCVVLRHRSSDVIIRCEQERSQRMNRILARRLLVERLVAQRTAQLAAEARRVAAIRRQQRKRPAWAQERLLAEKRRRSEKKTLRRSFRFGE